jgi:hypothetical protein
MANLALPDSRKGAGFASETAMAALLQSHSLVGSATQPPPDSPEAFRSAAISFAILAAFAMVLSVMFRPRSVDAGCMRAAHGILSVVRPQAAHGFSSRNLSSFDISANKYGFQKVAVNDR